LHMAVSNVLDRILITLAVRLHAFAYCEVQSGWTLVFGPMDAITIHYVLRGSGVVKISDGISADFRPHSIIIVPAGVTQSLGEKDAQIGEAAAESNSAIVEDGLFRFTAGDGTQDILVICGTITASYGGALGVFDHLQTPLVEDLSSSSDVAVQAFKLLLEELSRPTVGTQVMTECLMKQCLVLLFRQQLSRGVTSPFFSALQDERLARAVAAILEKPAAPHSVEQLASTAGMSRSSFVARFTQAYGQSPVDFVRKVRLRLAATLLSNTAIPISVIASNVGYSSRSYFSRAFRAAFGADPKTYRAFGGYAEKEPEAVAGDTASDDNGSA
jgi:AraC-like DNA-binding protein